MRLVSANDHIHARHSAHYAGFAVDLHSSNLDALAEMFRRIGYRVLWRVKGHFSHVHVEDPRAPAAVSTRTLRPVAAGASGPPANGAVNRTH